MKNIYWESQVYITSAKKLIFLSLLLIYFFVSVFTALNLSLSLYIRGGILLLLLILIYRKTDLIHDNVLQIIMYDKKPAQYEMTANELIIKYGNRKKLIPYKKIEYFTNISPFRIERSPFYLQMKHASEPKEKGKLYSDYAESSEFKVYYLFINKTSFYTAVLPIFIPPEQDEIIRKDLSSVILFTTYKITKDVKFCFWGCAFPLCVLVIIFITLISL